MSELIEVKTAELSGAALDWAVTKAEVYPGDMPAPDILWGKYCSPYSPSTDWSYGGPLIEKYRVDFIYERAGLVAAYACKEDGRPLTNDHYGSTHLIAACRAIVACVLGDTVSVPRDLLP